MGASELERPGDRHARAVGQVHVRRRVQHGQVGPRPDRDPADVGRGAARRRRPAVAAYTAWPGVRPISRTASAITNGIDEE